MRYRSPFASSVTVRLAVAAASVVAALGRFTLSPASETNVAVTMNTMRSTSVMSTIGVTLIPVTVRRRDPPASTSAAPRRSLEVREQDAGEALGVRDHLVHPRLEVVVRDDRGDRDEDAERRR